MRIGLCQIAVDRDPSENLDRACRAVADAAAGGADLAVLPEATLTRFGASIRDHAEPLDGPFIRGLAKVATECDVAVIVGVFEPSHRAGDSRVSNTAVVIDGSGAILAAYRKIHLFDAFGMHESEFVAPGDTPTVVDVRGLRFGLITCYDLRFPELARELVDHGADAFAVIAAWGTSPLREDHWVTLVKARAIENTMWTIAVGQASNPECNDGFGLGHSMLVDPMGVVRCDLGPNPATQVVEIDLDVTMHVRAALPCLDHRRLATPGTRG